MKLLKGDICKIITSDYDEHIQCFRNLELFFSQEGRFCCHFKKVPLNGWYFPPPGYFPLLTYIIWCQYTVSYERQLWILGLCHKTTVTLHCIYRESFHVCTGLYDYLRCTATLCTWSDLSNNILFSYFSCLNPSILPVKWAHSYIIIFLTKCLLVNKICLTLLFGIITVHVIQAKIYVKLCPV